MTSVRDLYRAWLQHARAFAWTWRNPFLYDAHAYLARRHISRVRKREMTRRTLAQTRQHVKYMAQASAGYPPAVMRALEQAYGRRGRLRHVLLAPVLPPHPTPCDGEDARYPPRLRLPRISRVLRALLLSRHTQRGSPPRESALKCPPKLAIAFESVERIPGRTVGRRRIANAHWRWLTKQMHRMRAPLCVYLAPTTPSMERGVKERIRAWNKKYAALYTQLETLAKPEHPTVPRHTGRKPTRTRTQSKARPDPAWLGSSREKALMWLRTPILRQCIDYTNNERARRRRWSAILAQSPVLALHARESDMTELEALVPHTGRAEKTTRTAAQGIAALTHAHMFESAQLSVTLSPFALYGGKGPRTVRAHATPAEFDWLCRR